MFEVLKESRFAPTPKKRLESDRTTYAVHVQDFALYAPDRVS